MNERVPGSSPWRRRGDAPPLAPHELHAAALSMLVARRAIRGTLPADMVHDAALEMLLQLYVDRPIPVPGGELAEQTTVSRLVGAHWLAALVAEGLVARAGDMVALTDAGTAAMERMLTAVIGSQRDVLGWGDH